MYIQMGTDPDIVTYTTVRNISFAPAVDLTCDSLPIDELTVDVETTDTITSGQRVELYDALDGLWARFWLYKVEKIGSGLLRLYARSDVALLDDVTLEATMYSAASAADVFADTLIMSAGHGTGIVGQLDYDLDPAIASMTVTGYCPEQTARERLQWLCMALGAVVKGSFVERLTIEPLDATATIVPLEDTYARPGVTLSEIVTEVRVTSYTLTPGTPTTTEQYVTDGNGDTYIVTSQKLQLVNPAATPEDPDNVVEIDGMYLINSTNASAILSRLADRHFKRTQISLDCVNNRAYKPGDRVTVYTDRHTMAAGYIEQTSFAFGTQAKASLALAAVEDVETAALTISYTWQGMTLAIETHTLPVGYAYSVTTRYLDQRINGHRYIFRPTVAEVTGTLTSEGAAATVPCEVALDLYKGTLHIISVDSATLDPTAIENVVVIA